jgi:hypothetical protein
MSNLGMQDGPACEGVKEKWGVLHSPKRVALLRFTSPKRPTKRVHIFSSSPDWAPVNADILRETLSFKTAVTVCDIAGCIWLTHSMLTFDRLVYAMGRQSKYSSHRPKRIVRGTVGSTAIVHTASTVWKMRNVILNIIMSRACAERVTVTFLPPLRKTPR